MEQNINNENRCEFTEIDFIFTFQHGSDSLTEEVYFSYIQIISRNSLDAVTLFDEEVLPNILREFYDKDEFSLFYLKSIKAIYDWELYEKITGKQSLPSLGYSCEWNFDTKNTDLDAWSQELIDLYGCGGNIYGD
jgi:hypothetical protein